MTRAVTVVDLGFGDAGKGALVDGLVARHRAELVVRFNGGAQAGHTVVTPEGRSHTFSQLGAGSFRPGTQTLLARHVVVHPGALLFEARHLEEQGVASPLARLAIARRALLSTPWHQLLGRARELLRGAARHGSCGVGVGEARRAHLEDPSASLFAKDLTDPARLHRLLNQGREAARELARTELAALRDDEAGREVLRTLDDPEVNRRTVELFSHVARAVRLLDEEGVRRLVTFGEQLVLEGAQGVLLDEDFGFHPYTTWSRTTFAHADELLDEVGFEGARVRLGVLRTYGVRHGPGPFPSEDAQLAAALPEPHNAAGPWQGEFRVGWCDLVAARYAVAACGGIDGLWVSHADRVAQLWRPAACVAYVEPTGERLVDLPLLEPSDASDVHLEALTRLGVRVGRCQPILEDLSGFGRAEDFVAAMASRVGVPLAGVSWGPTRQEQRPVDERLGNP